MNDDKGKRSYSMHARSIANEGASLIWMRIVAEELTGDTGKCVRIKFTGLLIMNFHGPK